MRCCIEQESVGLRVLAALARMVPDERERALERIENTRIALDIRLLVVADYPFQRQRREVVDALVVVRPQVVGRGRVEKAVEAQLAQGRLDCRHEIAADSGGLDELEQERRQVLRRSTWTGVSRSGVSTRSLSTTPTADVQRLGSGRPLTRSPPRMPRSVNQPLRISIA